MGGLGFFFFFFFLSFSLSVSLFFFFFQVLNRGGKKKKGKAREARVMGELDGGKEDIKLRQRRRGRHSCLAVEICERVNAAQGALGVAAGAEGSSDTRAAFFCHSRGCRRGL